MAEENRPKLRIFSGDGGGGGGRLRALLPGARRDWEREAGDLSLNDAVSIAANRLGDMFAMVPMVLKERGTDGKWRLVEGHPLTELWEYCNTDYDSATRDIAVALSIAVSGNAFLYIDRDNYGDPIGLYWLDHRHVKPIYPLDGSKYLTAWRYYVQGGMHVDIPPSDVLHFRRGIDPENTRIGISQLTAMLRKICLLNSADGYSVSVLTNMGVPGLVVTPTDKSVDIDDDAAGEIKYRMDKATTGDNAGSTIVLSHSVALNALGISPEKLSLDKLTTGAAHFVFAALGTSAEALGLPSATKTYENYPTAIKASWTFGIMPVLAIIRSAITRALFPEFALDPRKYCLEHDTSQVPELQEAQSEKHKRAIDAWNANTIPLNVFLEETGRAPDEMFGHLYKNEMMQAGQRDQADAESMVNL